jgi:hypothetical protein
MRTAILEAQGKLTKNESATASTPSVVFAPALPPVLVWPAGVARRKNIAAPPARNG